jgi:hypothetical protein
MDCNKEVEMASASANPKKRKASELNQEKEAYLNHNLERFLAYLSTDSEIEIRQMVPHIRSLYSSKQARKKAKKTAKTVKERRNDITGSEFCEDLKLWKMFVMPGCSTGQLNEREISICEYLIDCMKSPDIEAKLKKWILLSLICVQRDVPCKN